MNNKNNRASVASVVLESASGFRVVVIDRGAAIAAIQVPVAEGIVDVALRYPRLEDYVNDSYYLGSTIGRFANRIANGRLNLNGGTYQLATDPEADGHCLHGGPVGLYRKTWLLDPDGASRVKCRYIARHGEQGFPGRLDVSVTYQLLEDSALLIEYEATCDRETVVNLANHTYFNLDPDAKTICDHELSIHAERYTPVDDIKIPTGELRPVADSEFDFRSPVRLSSRMNGSASYDHNFVLNRSSDRLREAATLFSPRSGIRLRLLTTQPGLQLYTGDGLAEPFHSRAGLCLEAQNFPDAPNQPGFPSATLNAGETYRQRSVLEFSTEQNE
jgi:aldose 1-epimerase